MRIKHLLTTALAAAVGSGAICAAEPESTTENTQQSTPTEQTGQQVVTNNGEANWFIDMDYAGFSFQIPAGTVVQKGSKFTAKHPDGSFGLSMSNTAKASNQKISYELCRRLAESLHLPNPEVSKVKYGKCSGAKATGELEGQKVTILVLPYDDQEVTTVILATPDREEWVNHYLRTLKR